jgi:hypothetical protein
MKNKGLKCLLFSNKFNLSIDNTSKRASVLADIYIVASNCQEESKSIFEI